MENICEICSNQADVTCVCNTSLRFCYEHGLKHRKTLGNHDVIKLFDYDLHVKFSSSLTKLKKARNDVISMSNSLTQIVKSIANTHLDYIRKYINQIKKIMKEGNFNNDSGRLLEGYGNIEIKGSDLNEFTEIVKNYLRMYYNGSELSPPKINIKILQYNTKFLHKKEHELKILNLEIEEFKNELMKN